MFDSVLNTLLLLDLCRHSFSFQVLFCLCINDFNNFKFVTCGKLNEAGCNGNVGNSYDTILLTVNLL